MRDLRWVAQYADGRIIHEVTLQGRNFVESGFKALDLAQIVSFGLEGSGVRIGFLTSDGVISYNGAPLDLHLVSEDGALVYLTGGRDLDYRGILHEKIAASDRVALVTPGGRSLRLGASRDQVQAYVVGYKVQATHTNLGAWWFTLAAFVPADEGRGPHLLLRISTEKGFRGHLMVAYNDKRKPPIGTVLRPGDVNQMHLAIV